MRFGLYLTTKSPLKAKQIEAIQAIPEVEAVFVAGMEEPVICFYTDEEYSEELRNKYRLKVLEALKNG